ncbi:hypothetical protein F5B22DRAFT_610555 [Xylaria bambusicola]|uniref:uncharacterized protein n=1 Tax=Xylaria bambusicola TaxID=326684 RepID=UPI0020073DB7|nr:uncharacterized protein F5B22DRAFT_610555 [Xylaria bambusicola]KAI0514743.1 hypothetical protein F5B22DRAFT_610555 [Xylaria bambusicola]
MSNPLHGQRIRHRFSWLSHTGTLILGLFVGSLLTQSFTLDANPENCRQVGLSTAKPAEVIAAQESYATQCPESLEVLSPTHGFIQRRSVRVNGTYNIPSPFKGPPGPDVEAAWARYFQNWTFTVDEHTYRSSRPQHPEAAVRMATGENEGFLASFEATHQLHCLYNLFRASYLDYYEDERRDYEADPAKWHERVDHCTDIIRQKLECDRDTTLVSYNWVRGKGTPMANFNVERMCPEWSEMDLWLEEHGIGNKMPPKPSNVVELDQIP